MKRVKGLIDKIGIREVYVLLIMTLATIILSIYSSMAIFTGTIEQKNVASLVAGDVTQIISSEESAFSISGDQHYGTVTVNGGEEKFFNISITNNKPIKTSYKLYYKYNGDLTVLNTEVGISNKSTNEESGILNSYGSKVVRVGIINNSIQNITVDIGVQGGYENNEVKLDAGKNELLTINEMVCGEEGANPPELASGMIPVVYDESKDIWIKADETKPCAKIGDINLDNVVDSNDKEILKKYLSFDEVDYTEDDILQRADMDSNGKIDDSDFGDLSAYIGKYTSVKTCSSYSKEERNKNNSWYCYNEQKWANAVTVSDCSEKGDINQDGTISDEDVEILRNVIMGTSEDYTEEQILDIADMDGNGQLQQLDVGKLLLLVGQDACKSGTKNRNGYLESSAGTEIPMDRINGMWVWIPRYKYKIASNIGSSVSVPNPPDIDVVFEMGTATTGVDEATYRSNIQDNGTNENYYTHPSFRDGSKNDYKTSGWDEELTGFWVAKFRVSGSEDNMIIRPNEKLLKTQDISVQFKESLKFANGTMNDADGKVTFTSNSDNKYGLNTTLNNVDTHMLKNIEWASVVYLSQSKYGKIGNSSYFGQNKQLFLGKDDYSGRSVGSYSNSSNLYLYNDKTCSGDVCEGEKVRNAGQGASTTGTVYGVYDIANKKGEYVMANWGHFTGEKDMNSGFNGYYYDDNKLGEYQTKSDGVSFPDKKYYDYYTVIDNSDAVTKEKSIMGDAIWETKEWYSHKISYPHFAYSNVTDVIMYISPWIDRGESNTFSVVAGDFGSSYGNKGFRVVLIP